MGNLGDFELDKGVDDGGPPDHSLRNRVLLTGIVIVLGALVVYLAVKFRRPTTSNVRLQTERAVVPTTGTVDPRAEPGENIALAPLNETDPLVRELVARLSSHPKVVAWLTTDQLIRNFTVSIVNISSGQSPAKHLHKLTPSGPFRASSSGAVRYIDPRSYERYNDYADAVSGLDARGAARLYATLKPRIHDAALELGQREDFDATLERAIVELLKTPTVEGQVAVTPAPVYWAYADPRLESLSSAQRQLLRTGPRNVNLIQSKLRELAPHLGIAPDKLPAPQVIRP